MSDLLTGSAATFTVTNTLEMGAGSLQQAILNANTNNDADVIVFNIPPGGPQQIILTNDLPLVTSPLTIDATTQPGFSGTPIIELSGEGEDSFSFYGLRLNSHGNVVRGLVINRFRWYGIYLESGSSSNRIEGNWIGLDATGKMGQGMNGNGVTINGGSNNIVGGTNVLARNVIAGNTMHGVAIFGSGNMVQGNYIGTDVDGTNSIPNGVSFTGIGNVAGGVWLEGSGAVSNTIGGTVPGAGNLISGNVRNIYLSTGTKGNFVQGNIIGLNAAGNARLNGLQSLTGVYIFSSDSNLIGGTTTGARNIISGNGRSTEGIEGAGVSMRNCVSNILQGNFIGTDVTGTLSVGNLREGITLEFSGNNCTVGGTTPGARNVISGNGSVGLMIRDSKDHVIQGNAIGTQADGVSPLGNVGTAIHLLNGSGVSIGGTTAAAGNVIAFNGVGGGDFAGYGVFVAEQFGGKSTNNLIRRNSIHSNWQMGIELFNINCFGCEPFNDSGDGDNGPNFLQNFPVLNSASTSGGSIAITGTINSIANSPFTIEFFANPGLDRSGFGEGKTYIGSVGVVTDASGNASFNPFFVDAGYTGQFITATATDAARNTSEFSAAVATDNPGGVVQFSQATYQQSEAGGWVTIFLNRIAGSTGNISVHYSTSNGTATAGSDYTATSGTLNFGDGITFQSFSIPITNDTANEPDETIQISLDSPVNAGLGPQSNSIVVIQDNDPILVFAGDAGVTKPTIGTNLIYFPISLSSASTRTVSVSYATANITAEAGVDYLSATGRVDLLPGVTNQMVPVTILGNEVQEGAKSFLLTLSNPTNGVFGDSQAQGTIYDGTQGVLQFSSATYDIGENGVAATINVIRVGGALGSVSVPFSTSNGSATSGSDYTPTNGVLIFNNGQTNQSFHVSISDDVATEEDKTVLLQLGTPANTSLGTPSSATLTIQDNDLPQLSIRSVPEAVVLQWPTQASNFQLESSFAIPGSWTTVSNVPSVIDNQFTVTNSASETNRFFRLKR